MIEWQTIAERIPGGLWDGDDLQAMASSCRPLADRVLVLRDPPPKERGGLVLVDQSKPSPNNFGTVIALGAGRSLKDGSRLPLAVSVGDRIAFSRFAGLVIRSKKGRAQGGRRVWRAELPADDALVIVEEKDIGGVIGPGVTIEAAWRFHPGQA